MDGGNRNHRGKDNGGGENRNHTDDNQSPS